MIPRHFQLVKHSIRFPEPMMFSLCDIGFSVVSVEIRIISIVAAFYESSVMDKISKRSLRVEKFKTVIVKLSKNSFSNLIFFLKFE
jgi:hypothetical protein